MISCELDRQSGHLIIQVQSATAMLSALWLRERSLDPAEIDLLSLQRYADPARFPADLSIVAADSDPGGVRLSFSDGHVETFDLDRLAVEAGLVDDPTDVPAPRPWMADTLETPTARFPDLGDDATMRAALDRFFRTGFLILRDTPTEPDSLLAIASTFGPIRETNWGRLFNVRTVPAASDLAYTGLALTPHSDNPYRRAVPGIQFLHCLENGATGGDSTVVDGLALAEALRAEMPEAHRALATLPATFRYLSAEQDDRETAPILSYGANGRLQIRFSTKLDYVRAADPETLSQFYAGRRRLAELARDPAHVFQFKMAPGDCLMMDNHRTLHGRTAFAEDGHRFLQGCYIDHDAPESRYRVLTRRQAGLAGEIAA